MKYTLTPYNEFIAKSRYARYLDNENRRENWDETVKRYFDFITLHLKEKYNYSIDEDLYQELISAVQNLDVLPSMRSIMTAGPALERQNVAGYNCAYLPIDDIKSFDELMYILLCGTGVGYSVESRYVSKLPEIPDILFDSDTTIVVSDSKEGWAKSLRQLIALLYSGEIPKYNTSKVRKAGTRLKTFGGRASGPEPLIELFEFVILKFKNAVGRRLYDVECHDICCKIGDVVVVGGVRRCLPSDSLVHTKLGMKSIQYININDLVLTSKGYKKVTNKFYQGKQKLIRVNTQDSYFDCTPNHKIAVLNGQLSYVWKMAKDLKTEDRIIAPSFSLDGQEMKLPNFQYVKPKHSTTCKDIIIPELDNDIAWLLGFIQGDGYVRLTSKTGEVCIPINNNELEIGRRVEEQIKRFGANIGRINYENYYVLKIKSKQLVAYFQSFLKKPNTELLIPEFIWNSKHDIKLSFVAGLMDADGSTQTRPIQVCTTVYENYAKQIRLLLSSCGIQSRLKKVSESGLKENWQVKYCVCLINTKSKAAVANSNLIKELKISKNERCSNTYSKELLDFAYSNNYCWSRTDNPLIPVSISSLELLEEEKETWDIEVEEMHEFFCEGYLMHNSAMISLSDLFSSKMAHAKSGQWWIVNKQRELANNSAVYDTKPDIGEFMKEWISLYESKSGERGIFSREASTNQVKKNGRRDSNHQFGTNPCSEIILRPYQFCNLTTCIIRSDDTMDSIKNKIRLSTILGTFQSTLTNFPYLRKIWQKNTEGERLLGVSMTGVLDNNLLNNYDMDGLPERLTELRELSVEVNRNFAEKLGISQSAAITCIKPEGTTSQLASTSSGLHPQYSKFYIRNTRGDNKDPLTKFMRDTGFINEPCNSKPQNTTIFSFPMKAPEVCVTREELDSISHLKLWLLYQRYYCEHKPSITVNIKEEDWIKVGAWVYENFDEVTGIAFMPYDNGIYKQSPFIPITEEEYNELLEKTPKSINWEELKEFDDNIEGAQQLACSSGYCEI